MTSSSLQKKAVPTSLSTHGRPFEWAISAGGVLYTAAAPIKDDGTAETGDIKLQARLTLSNLAATLAAAGGSMADVTQVMLYVTSRSFIDPITEIWAEAFPTPYPNRGTVIVSEIGIKDVGMLIMAHAYLGKG
ncbi:RidA family protein [Rhodoligotrophos ferricapiens]|uniref:RidA family protein n=1 Tax=Rhodoligotrophos ferricapiens TaxID=3069264 RepID=UPI00315D0D6A